MQLCRWLKVLYHVCMGIKQRTFFVFDWFICNKHVQKKRVLLKEEILYFKSIASDGQLLLSEMVISNLYAILGEAQKVKWPILINRKAQHGVGKHGVSSSNTFWTNFKQTYQEHNVGI